MHPKILRNAGSAGLLIDATCLFQEQKLGQLERIGSWGHCWGCRCHDAGKTWTQCQSDWPGAVGAIARSGDRSNGGSYSESWLEFLRAVQGIEITPSGIWGHGA